MSGAAIRRSVVIVAAGICIHAAPVFGEATGPNAAASATPSKRCQALTKKVARQEKSLDAIADAVVRERRARETCTSKTLCARYDSSIQTLEKRIPQQEARVTRFKADAAAACAKP